MEHGTFDKTNPPELVTRFIKLCEVFKETAHKSENGLGGVGHTLYYNSMNSLDVWGDEEAPSFKIKGVGQVHRGLSGHRFEINEFLLNGLEKRFGLKENEAFSKVNQSILTQLHVNLVMNNADQNKLTGNFYCTMKVNPLIAMQFIRNKRIAPEFGLSPVNASYDNKTGVMRFEGKSTDFDDTNNFKKFLLTALVENKLSINQFADKGNIENSSDRKSIEAEFEYHKLDEFFEQDLPIIIEDIHNSNDKLVHSSKDVLFNVPENHYLLSIAEQLNELHELTREEDHAMSL